MASDSGIPSILSITTDQMRLVDQLMMEYYAQLDGEWQSALWMD